MEFWTALQWPLAQAAYIKDSKIALTIPATSAKTPARHVAAVGEFNGNLVIQRRSCMELWTPDGQKHLKHLYHPWFYSVHSVLQYGEAMMVLSTGIDLIFVIDWDGNVSWQWWAWKHNLSGNPTFIHEPNWPIQQTNSNTLKAENALHMNSLFIKGNKIYTSSLSRKRIIEIDIATGTPKMLMPTLTAPHYPIPIDNTFLYGEMNGITLGKKKVVDQERMWVKYIKAIDDGYLFSYQTGIIKINKNFERVWEVELPAPFGIGLYKE